MRSEGFFYGQSDLNFLILVKTDCHPKLILNEFREFISQDIVTSLIVNTAYVPVLTQEEFSIPQIKSFLIRNIHKKEINWKSVFNKNNFSFHLNDIEHSAISFSAMQNLDFYLFRSLEPKTPRVRIKNIHRDLVTLESFYPLEISLSSKWKKLAKWTQYHPIINFLFYKTFIKQTWLILTSITPQLGEKKTKNPLILDQKLEDHLQSLLELDFIQDITITPSIIQNNLEVLKGKLFIELHIKDQLITDYYGQLNNIKEGFKLYESKNLKFRIRVIASSIYFLQNKNALYPFPLEPLLRNKITYSVAGNDYKYNVSKDQILKSTIYFFVSQFMRFRSLEQKTELIGSKFIKSLNLMYRYYLLLDYLKNKEFKFHHSEKEIRSCLTPQFSEIQINDVVTEEDWIIIRSQLLYLLKGIRAELSQYNGDLKKLKF
jgi:hypothetical protein